jgi:hypothetical protein
METQFTLTSIDTKTVTYDLGGGPMPCESSFYAAGYGDFIAIEHHTMNYFGTRQVPLSGVTVNGATFTNDTDAVQAINALDLFGEKEAGGGNPPVDPIWKDVTEMFDIPTTDDITVLMKDDGIGKPMIQIHGVNRLGSVAELVITPAFGFGSYYTKTKVEWGLDSAGNPVSYKIQIAGETDVARGTITFPAALDSFDVTYFVGATVAPKVSYYVDTNGVYHEFSAENTPIKTFCVKDFDYDPIIGGIPVPKMSIAELHFGDDYSSVSTVNEFMAQYLVLQYLTLPVGLTSVGDSFMRFDASLSRIQIRNLDASRISVGVGAFAEFEYNSPGIIYADTQELGEAFRAKFPPISKWSIVVNP